VQQRNSPDEMMETHLPGLWMKMSRPVPPLDRRSRKSRSLVDDSSDE
jgi:hypothetical protein